MGDLHSAPVDGLCANRRRPRRLPRLVPWRATRGGGRILVRTRRRPFCRCGVLGSERGAGQHASGDRRSVSRLLGYTGGYSGRRLPQLCFSCWPRAFLAGSPWLVRRRGPRGFGGAPASGEKASSGSRRKDRIAGRDSLADGGRALYLPFRSYATWEDGVLISSPPAAPRGQRALDAVPDDEFQDLLRAASTSEATLSVASGLVLVVVMCGGPRDQGSGARFLVSSGVIPNVLRWIPGCMTAI